jgi:RNA polymerase sigma factor for flagellar operon FliA
VSMEHATRLGHLVQERYPGVVAVILPYSSEEDPGVAWILRILNVPDDQLCDVEDFAWSKSDEILENGTPDFYVSAHGSHTSPHFSPSRSPSLPPSTSRGITRWVLTSSAFPESRKSLLPNLSPREVRGQARLKGGKLMDPRLKTLWLRYKSTGAMDARNQLLERYYPLVEFLSERIIQRLPRSVDVDDLKSAGVFGLMSAIDGFELDRGIKFETYCAVRVRGAILDELRARDWVPRVVRSRAHKRSEAVRTLSARLQRPPLRHEVAEYLGWTESEIAESMMEEGRATVLSLGGGEDASEISGGSRLRFLTDDRLGSALADTIDLREVSDFVLKSLTPKERKIIVLYYFEQMTMRSIGEFLGISESRVSQIHSHALKRLQQFFKVGVGAQLVRK